MAYHSNLTKMESLRMMKEVEFDHVIKISSIYFNEVQRGVKTFEIRKNDRDYKVGDKVRVVEHKNGEPTFRSIGMEILYITDFEQNEGWVVWSFKKLKTDDFGVYMEEDKSEA